MSGSQGVSSMSGSQRVFSMSGSQRVFSMSGSQEVFFMSGSQGVFSVSVSHGASSMSTSPLFEILFSSGYDAENNNKYEEEARGDSPCPEAPQLHIGIRHPERLINRSHKFATVPH